MEISFIIFFCCSSVFRVLEFGADPYVENDLGMNAFEICDEAGPFPSVSYVLEEHSGRE